MVKIEICNDYLVLEDKLAGRNIGITFWLGNGNREELLKVLLGDTTKLELDGTDIGTTAICLGELRYDLSEEEQAKVIEFMIDGYCPFCFDEIPDGSKVCCECLRDIAQYHERQEGCIGLQYG